MTAPIRRDTVLVRKHATRPHVHAPLIRNRHLAEQRQCRGGRLPLPIFSFERRERTDRARRRIVVQRAEIVVRELDSGIAQETIAGEHAPSRRFFVVAGNPEDRGSAAR